MVSDGAAVPADRPRRLGRRRRERCRGAAGSRGRPGPGRRGPLPLAPSREGRGRTETKQSPKPLPLPAIVACRSPPLFAGNVYRGLIAVSAVIPLGDSARMKLEDAIGKALDDLKDYPAAIRYFDAANLIEKGLTSYDRGRLLSWMDELIGTMHARLLRATRRTGCG